MTPQQIESSAAFGKDCGRIKEAIYFLLNVRDYLSLLAFGIWPCS